MTVAQILAAARGAYNATGDTFFTDSDSGDMLTYLYHACIKMARETMCIEDSFTTSTVASQQEYTYPTNAIAIKRINYEGNKLIPIDMMEDDALTLMNAATTATETPQCYFTWNETIYLRPIPSAVGTLKIFAYLEPAAVTSTSTLEIPSVWHMDLVDFVLSKMYAKDKDFAAAREYMTIFMNSVMECKRLMKKKKRGDAMAAVKDEESLANATINF